MTVVDVRQGDAVVLELPGKRTILIGGGGLYPTGRAVHQP